MNLCRIVLALSAFGLPVVAPAAEPPAAHGQLTRAPELLEFVEAEFPPSEAGRTGAVVLSLTLSPEGSVEEVSVVESAGPAFDAAAVAAARQFRFSPAEVDGAPSRIQILYRYAFVERVAAPTTARFTGVVRDREAKVPLADVTVTLSDGRAARTDADGRFVFEDVPPGTLALTFEGERLTALTTEETFVAGEQLDATYDLFLIDPDEPVDDLEIVVEAPALRRQAVSTEVAADEARKIPGTQGDVLRVVENLPGVARAGVGTGALVVWGAAPDDTGVYIDGVRVPRLYHDGGLRSVVGSDLVRSVELVPGAYGAGYGRGLGGLVSVKTRGFDDEPGVHGAISADLYDAGGSLRATIGRVNLAVSGRQGYVGPLLSAFRPDVGDFFPIPHYSDVQGRIGVRLAANQTLDLTVLTSSDRTARTAPSADPAREASEEKTLQFQRVYARYASDLGDGSTVNAVVFGGAEASTLRARFGATETALDQDTATFGLRANYRARALPVLTLEGGVDAELRQTDVIRRGSLALPGREGDIRVFGQPPPDQITADAYRVTSVGLAPYGEADLGLLDDRLHVVGGIRLDPNIRSVSRAEPALGGSPSHGLLLQDFRAEPRASVRFAPDERWRFTAAAGRYAQTPSPGDLSASFGTPALPIATATHVVASAGVSPIPQVHVDATGFYTASEGLAMRSAAEQPARAEALAPTGSGRSYGAQLMARVDPLNGWYGWLSYTLSWSERRDRPGVSWRPSDYDQRHVLTALAGVTLPFGLDVSARARVATGLPRTQVVGALYDSRRDLYQPLFGVQNEMRLPVFFQGDVRVSRAFPIGRTALDVWLEVQNVTNQQNVEEYIYNADYSERGAIRGLPILPALGLRWSF